MSIHKNYAVFGLGRYGQAVAKELVDSGAEVLAVDMNEEIVNDAISEIPYCKCADITNPETIKQLGIGNMDVVIIAMAQNLEASVMATMLCKEAGVETVIVKCGSEMHQKILRRIGAEQVVLPENESGIRLAKNLLCSGFIDMISLSKDVSMVEIDVKGDWVGKNLIELNLRKRYDINVVAMKKGGTVRVNINPEQKLDAETTLIVLANTAKLGKLK